MSGTMIEFAANGRTAQGYLSQPPSGKGPGLIVIQEYWGLVDHIKALADRFAQEGFVALAPDLYEGDSTRSPDEASRKMMALDIARASTDLKGAADHLRSLDSVSPKKVGALGFCMGGQLALLAACDHGEKIDAAVDFYGIHPQVELNVESLQAPVLAHFAKNDEFVPLDSAKELVQRIEQAGKKVEAHYYDSGHAFFNDTRPEAYDNQSAEQAWERTMNFLRAHLR